MSQRIEKLLNDFLYDEEDEFFDYEYLDDSELDLRNVNNNSDTMTRT